MVEMSKGLKIILIVDIFVAIYYGVLYLFLPELYYQMNDAPAFDLQMWRLFGGTVFVLGIVGVVALKRGNWESVKPLMEMVILWLTMVAILDIIFVLSVSASATYVRSISTTIVLLIILIIVNIYFYRREGNQ
jgi:energy-converting hydrogenase Eha subunit C